MTDVFSCLKNRCGKNGFLGSRQEGSGVDFYVVQHKGAEVGAYVGRSRAAATRRLDGVGYAAQVDRLAINSLGAFHRDGDLGTFAVASFLDTFYPACRSGAGLGDGDDGACTGRDPGSFEWHFDTADGLVLKAGELGRE